MGSQWLAAACLLALCVPAWGGSLGTDFSNKFSRGLQKTLAGNNNVGSIVPAASGGNLGEKLSACPRGAQTPECKWLTFVVGCLAMGLVICPLLCFFVCCGFCIGRRCCECCCKPCGQPQCGGPKPTREYPAWDTWGCLAVALPIFFVMLLSFTAVGFASLQEVPSDIDGVFDGLKSMSTTPIDFKQDIRDKTADLKVTIKGKLTPLNDAFALINPVKTAVSTLRERLVALENAIKDLAMLIEGCSSGSTAAQCSFSTTSPNPNLSRWNKCPGATDTSAPTGNVPMRLSDGTTTNPSCKNPTDGSASTCKCCNACNTQLVFLSTTLSQMPTDTMLNGISVEIPVDQLDTEIDKALGNFEEPLDNMADSWPIKTTDVDNAKESMGDITGLVAGINCGIWLPQWLALVAILVALALGRKGAPEKQSKCGDWCWWIAYTVGVIWFIFLVCPMFGLWSVIAIPLEDICDIMPVVGGTSEKLVDLILEAESDFDHEPLQKMLDNCVLKASGGYIWSILDLKKTDFSDILSEFDRLAQTPVADQEASLDVATYVKPFTDNTAAFKSFSAATYTPASSSCTFGTCAAETTAYTTDLNAKIAAIATATDAVTAQVTATTTASDAFWAKLKESLSGSNTFTNEMVDSLWAFGECNLISQKYDEFVTPFCVVSDNLGAFWACVLMVGCAWLAMFPIIACASKRWFQLREGYSPDGGFDTFTPIAVGQGMPPLNPPAVAPGQDGDSDKPTTANGMDPVLQGDAPISADVVAVMNKSSPPNVPQYPAGAGLPPVSEEDAKPNPRLPVYPVADPPARMARPVNVTSGSDMPFPPPINPEAAAVAPPRRVPSYPVARGPPNSAGPGDSPAYPNLEISKIGIV